MLNTWGLCSIRDTTFNLKHHTNYGSSFSRQNRDVIVTGLRIHNICLDILGYFRDVSGISGYIRMFSGLTLCVVTLTVGNRRAQEGFLIQHWYDEALVTGLSQIARGALEAFIPYGRVINLSLGFIATLLPYPQDRYWDTSACLRCSNFKNHRPLDDTMYPSNDFLRSLLHFA
jgi:hypothetical protein